MAGQDPAHILGQCPPLRGKSRNSVELASDPILKAKPVGNVKCSCIRDRRSLHNQVESFAGYFTTFGSDDDGSPIRARRRVRRDMDSQPNRRGPVCYQVNGKIEQRIGVQPRRVSH